MHMTPLYCWKSHVLAVRQEVLKIYSLWGGRWRTPLSPCFRNGDYNRIPDRPFLYFSLTHTQNACTIFSATYFPPPGEKKSRPATNDGIPVGCLVPVRTGKWEETSLLLERLRRRGGFHKILSFTHFLGLSRVWFLEVLKINDKFRNVWLARFIIPELDNKLRIMLSKILI